MSELAGLRKKVDAIDQKIFEALLERVEVCRQIGLAKKKNGLPVKDAGRESQVYERIKQKSEANGLDSTSVLAVYREIVNMCSCVQE
jgi:4-amino-4-deoxychorismate mutase